MAAIDNFYKLGVDDAKVYGGPARVLMALSTTTYPLRIQDVLNFTTYQPQTGWFDLGHTNEPFTSTNSFDTTDWISQQVGRINIQVGNWDRTIGVTFMESLNTYVMDIVHSADVRESNVDGDRVTYFTDLPDVDEFRLVAAFYDRRRNRLVMDVFPRVKRSGADAETAWDRENPQAHGTEFAPLPDSNIPNSPNWYRIEEVY